MVRLVAAVLAGALAGASGCAKKPPPAPAAPAPAAAAPEDTRPRLSLDVDPSDAEVLIDDQVVGTGASVSSLPLDPGLHRIVVRKPGYEPWRAEVTLDEGTESLEVTLEEEQ
jgi:hypothetical protein